MAETQVDHMAIMKEDARQKRERRTMTPKQKRKAKREASLGKATYRMDRELVEIVNSLSRRMQTPQAGIVGCLIAHGLRAYACGDLDFSDYLFPAANNSFRWKWVIHVPTDGLAEEVESRTQRP